MTADWPTDADIIGALQASGYLMEQEVATDLESLGFTVRTGRAYRDQDTGVSREIDVWARKELCRNDEAGLVVTVELVCECKNNTNPLVFLIRPRQAHMPGSFYWDPEEYLFPIQRFETTIEDDGQRYKTMSSAFMELELYRHHYSNKQPYRAVHVCKIVRDRSAWKAQSEDIYNAMFMPVIKSMLHMRAGVASWFRSGHPKYVWLFVPIVVVNDAMYAVDALASSLEPRRITHINYQRELESGAIQGRFAVDFVARSWVRDFLQADILPFARHVCQLAQESPERFLEGKEFDLGE